MRAKKKSHWHGESFGSGLEIMYLRCANILREQYDFNKLRLDDNFKRLCSEFDIEIELANHGGYKRREKDGKR